MSVLRTIKCNVDGCGNLSPEKEFGDGWPGWGELHGRVDDATGSTGFGLCPKHLEMTFHFVSLLRG